MTQKVLRSNVFSVRASPCLNSVSLCVCVCVCLCAGAHERARLVGLFLCVAPVLLGHEQSSESLVYNLLL